MKMLSSTGPILGESEPISGRNFPDWASFRGQKRLPYLPNASPISSVIWCRTAGAGCPRQPEHQPVFDALGDQVRQESPDEPRLADAVLRRHGRDLFGHARGQPAGEVSGFLVMRHVTRPSCRFVLHEQTNSLRGTRNFRGAGGGGPDPEMAPGGRRSVGHGSARCIEGVLCGFTGDESLQKIRKWPGRGLPLGDKCPKPPSRICPGTVLLAD